ALAPFTAAVHRVRLSEPRIPFVSNVTGTWILPEEATDPGYWARHLRGTVRFADGVATLLAEPDRVLLEAGPGRTLSTHAARQAVGRPAIASLRHPREEGSDLASILTAAGRLWLAGHRLNAEKLFAGQERRRIPLPSYPFERHRYWIEPGEDWSAAASAAPAQTLHARPALPTAYVAPRSEFEEEVAGIWREVLGVREVGAHDSFLELGGDSLLATRLMSRLRDELGLDLPMERLFERPTVAAVAAAARKAEAPAGRISRRLRDGKTAFPLSFAQERLWFFDRLEPGSALYNIPAGIEATGRLDVAALAAALSEIVRRHEALRTTFPGGEGEPVQEIHSARPVTLPVADLSALPEPARGEEARRLATAEARRPFDLARGPLLRTLLLRLGEEEHLAVLTVHHIVSDGWSMGVLVREIAALASGQPSPLPELPLQYADYAVWQRKHLQGEVLQEQLAYWREQLAGAPAALELPTDRPRPPVQTFRGAQMPVVLPPALVQALRELGRETGSTLFMIVLAVFETLLARHTGQEDLLVGSPIANRNRAEIEGLIGFFVNTLVMRGDLSGDPTFAELLARVRETALAAYAHQDLPFERLVEELHPARDLSRGPLVQVMASLQRAQAEALELPGLLLTPRDLDSGTAKFELTLHLAEGAESAAGWIEYNADLFEAPTVARFAGQLVRLLEAAPAGLSHPVADLPLFSAAEQQALFAEWNAAPGELIPEGRLHSMVFAQARRFPEAVALVAGEETWTYGELSRRAEAIARRLRALGVGPETRVGISMAKSPERIAALLGILLAGGAYVPLDPAYPRERLAFILEDSGARMLVTERDLGGEDLEEGGPVPDDVLPDHLAYVIYTSGSTGRPKGVLVRHAGVCRVIAESIRLFGLGPESRVPHLASLSFDASVLEMFTALAAGGTLLLLPGGLLGPDLADELRRHRATFLVASPALLDTLPGSALPDLRTVTVGGEACSAETAAAWSERVALFNCYAPTETTIYSTTGRCHPGARRVPPMGRPIAGARAYLLDRRLRPVPLGAQGEIYVGGEGVARGYHGRPDLTAERFVPDPWSPEPGARLYRTGDLARRLPGGELEFAGRNDSQVKLRGFRVELGEVEAALARHEAVERTVAVVREDAPGDRRLVAYAVLREGEAATPAALRAFLKESLPEFMVPAAVLLLDALP
ncbi:MAG TPA: amino acid adenylation domain-containing protein, partial [Thermoanaerobaculia bacterium]|nr:amino acid adenylation domain-containing protein [Thermoanaerobaculia bacterium]